MHAYAAMHRIGMTAHRQHRRARLGELADIGPRAVLSRTHGSHESHDSPPNTFSLEIGDYITHDPVCCDLAPAVRVMSRNLNLNRGPTRAVAHANGSNRVWDPGPSAH